MLRSKNPKRKDAANAVIRSAVAVQVRGLRH
jgi:hypothetical protein